MAPPTPSPRERRGLPRPDLEAHLEKAVDPRPSTDADPRRLVIDSVVADVRRAAAEHDRVVLLAHGLGTVVGYDLFDSIRSTFEVPLFIDPDVARPIGHVPADQRPW